MPIIPEPTGAPEQMPFLRWVKEQITSILQDNQRQLASDKNTNASQNSTMTMLVDRLGQVQDSLQALIDNVNIAASQVTSGVFDAARIPNIDAAKVNSGTITRPVNAPGDVTATGHGTFNAAWGYNVSAITRMAVWMDSSGRLGQTSSTERFKKDIESWAPNMQAVLAMELVRFHWKPEHGDPNHWEHGLIAEQLDELGLRWLVVYEDDNKTPLGVHYDRIALALLPVVQDLAFKVDWLQEELGATNDRLNDIEARLALLEDN